MSGTTTVMRCEQCVQLRRPQNELRDSDVASRHVGLHLMVSKNLQPNAVYYVNLPKLVSIAVPGGSYYLMQPREEDDNGGV